MKNIISTNWLYENLGNKNLVRTVGYILSKNTDRVNIPCHRVIRSNGEIWNENNIINVENTGLLSNR